MWPPVSTIYAGVGRYNPTTVVRCTDSGCDGELFFVYTNATDKGPDLVHLDNVDTIAVYDSKVKQYKYCFALTVEEGDISRKVKIT